MQEDIISITISYLESQRLNRGLSDTHFQKRLMSIGMNSEKAEAIMLKMDNEWTAERLVRAQLKQLKKRMAFSYIAFVVGLIITLLSLFGLILGGKIIILFYGAILGGVVSVINAKSSISKLNNRLELRKYIWKRWVRE